MSHACLNKKTKKRLPHFPTKSATQCLLEILGNDRKVHKTEDCKGSEMETMFWASCSDRPYCSRACLECSNIDRSSLSLLCQGIPCGSRHGHRILLSAHARNL